MIHSRRHSKSGRIRFLTSIDNRNIEIAGGTVSGVGGYFTKTSPLCKNLGIGSLVGSIRGLDLERGHVFLMPALRLTTGVKRTSNRLTCAVSVSIRCCYY